jgi:hypothetical protein
MCRSAASRDCARSGSHTTMSASEPGRRQPLRGNRPNVRAGASAHRRTQSARVIRPARTPCHTSVRRVSTPGSPPGISVKSAKPSGRSAIPRRRSSVQNGQWSVATVCTQPRARPSHSSSRCHGSRSGGVHTKFSPPGPPGPSRPGAGTGDTSRRAAPRPAPGRPAPRPVPGAEDRWTTYTGAPATSASRPTRLTASASSAAGRVSRCETTEVRPSASARRRSASMAPPFSQCTVTRPPWRAHARSVSNTTSSSTCSSCG